MRYRSTAMIEKINALPTDRANKELLKNMIADLSYASEVNGMLADWLQAIGHYPRWQGVDVIGLEAVIYRYVQEGETAE